ncbi:MAG TPA: UvrD-helicase domain-containing protein, partial [Pseudobdellovibrionaceae bacterium]|nr:UvrD-helicase domain-containing protein [Pseudobdellovibrionaceae bacterium]
PSPRVPGKKKTCTENARIDEAIGALKELWKLLRLKSKLVDVYPTYEQTTNTIDLILEEFISKVWTQKIAGKGDGDSEFSRHEVCALAEEIIRKSDHARAHFSAQFDYWFIDEFQDTSPRQTQLLTEWIGSTPHFVVGDPQQSIYLFRGARPYVFHEKHREMLKQGAREFNLLRNYRSQPEIIHFVNDYFSERPGFSPMETRPNHDVNSQVLKQAQTPVQYWNMAVNSGDAIGEMEDHESEEGGDLQNDRRLIGAAIRAKSLQVLGARWSEIAVLTYTNSQSERVLQFLRDQGIPARLEGTADFFTTALAMELAAVVRFMLVPNHNENFLALCRTPELGLSDQLLGDLMFEIRKKEFRSESHPESLFQFFVRCGQSAIAETKDYDELTPGPMAVPISVPERSLQVILETFSMAKSAGILHALWNWIHQLGILSREA